GQARHGGHDRGVGDAAALVEHLEDVAHGVALAGRSGPDQLHDLGLQVAQHRADARAVGAKDADLGLARHRHPPPSSSHTRPPPVIHPGVGLAVADGPSSRKISSICAAWPPNWRSARWTRMVPPVSAITKPICATPIFPPIGWPGLGSMSYRR